MKIQCQSCQAKYTIADEKVLGKVVKIRCKKCSSTIVINGNDHAAAGGDAGDANAFDYASGAGGDGWTVNVADGDQRTMTVAEIVAEYKNGVVNDETYCWKDGMADWLPLREVGEIAAQLKGGASRMPEEMMSLAPAGSVPPPAAANLFATPAPAEAFAGSVSPKPGGTNGSAGLFAGASAVETAPAAAARRAGGRGQGGDLFGNVEKAGGEDDVMTSAANAAVAANAAAAAGAAPPVHDEKLTGQRNENSVLFSLSALTDKKPEGGSSSSSSSSSSGNGNRTTASADGSGLIDIRALSANMDEDGAKKKDKGARVDDIMNLSGGGAFGAALAAPILAPPPLEPMDLGVAAPAEAPKQSKTLVFAILGGCALIAIGIVVAVVMTRPGTPADTKTGATGSASASPDTTGSVATAAPTDSSNPASTGSVADNTPAAPGTGNKPGSASPGGVHPGAAPAGHPAGHPGAVAANGGGGDTTPPAPATAAAPKPADFNSAMAAAAGQPAAPAGGGGGGGGSTASFDKGAAAGSLGKVDVQGCKKSDGPTGPGHVTVTFQPDGSVQSAVVDQGPYPGTPVGGCVAGRFKGAHVPAFAGAPVRVGKSFIIN